jgi:MYXO-CTERM domain-containing protein
MDAGGKDSGTTDSGVEDSGKEAGGVDAGGMDAGGQKDAGMMADSGTKPDSGMMGMDSSVPPQQDSGEDSGLFEASADGSAGSGPTSSNGGCGCVTAGNDNGSLPSSGYLAFGLPLLLVVRRRRNRKTA